MIRQALSLIVFGAMPLLACAETTEPPMSVTTTTSATVPRHYATCARSDATCVIDADCCSGWCVAERCERREP